MKNVLLSADNNPSVYSVPDIVADNLREYCIKHFYKWLKQSPKAKKYRLGRGYAFDEKAFIEFITLSFPNENPKWIKTLNWITTEKDIPTEYKGCKWFNF